MIQKFVFSLLIGLLLFGFAFSWNDTGGGVCTCSTNCTDCSDALNSSVCSTEVQLTTDIASAGGDCIPALANFSNKIFDCQGNSISGPGTDIGIHTNNQENNTVENCRILGYNIGMYLENSTNTTVVNNTFYSNPSVGLASRLSTLNNITNNTAYNNTDYGFSLTQSSFNNTLTENIAYNNTRGFRFDTACSFNKITNNLAYDHSLYGFYVTNSHWNTFIDNTAYNNNDGFYLQSSDNSGYPFIDNTAYNNARYGLYMFFVDINITDTTLYNNSRDVEVSTERGSASFNMTNTLFLNPAGTLVNYTNLSSSDIVADGDGYSISWSASPLTLPEGGTSFAQKFLNITTVSGPPSIDSLTWHWLDSELGGYTETLFVIWEYNSSGWGAAALNNTPNTAANTLSLYNHTPESIYGILEYTAPTPPVDDGGDDEEPECESDEDCLNECYYCSIGNDACLLRKTSECGVDEDCQPSYEKYDEGVYMDIPYENKDMDPEKSKSKSKLFYLCEECQCVSYECFEDSDCPDGYTCENNTCTPPECFEDEDCLTGYYCEEYECVQEEQPEGEEPEDGGPAGIGSEEIGEEPLRPEQPPFPEPAEIAKEVVPLLEEAEKADDLDRELWETIITGVWIALFIILLIAILYVIFSRKKRRTRKK